MKLGHPNCHRSQFQFEDGDDDLHTALPQDPLAAKLQIFSLNPQPLALEGGGVRNVLALWDEKTVRFHHAMPEVIGLVSDLNQDESRFV
jgi:hypothetical protein